MTIDLPKDWYADHDGQSLVLDPNKVAAEIERLTAENERLRAALGEIANYGGAKNDDAEPCREIARRALNQQQAVNSEEGK